MLDVKDKMDSDLPVAFQCLSTFSYIFEGLVLIELGHLKGSGVLPLGIAIALVKFNSMVVISWDFIIILVSWCCVIGLEFGLVDHAKKLLVLPGNAFKVLPTIKIE